MLIQLLITVNAQIYSYCNRTV